jgi:hypothetical protein
VINQFVVFEMASEMNNKYDINNFAKFLESFSSAKEMERVDVFLQDGYMPVVGQPQFDFVEFNT